MLSMITEGDFIKAGDMDADSGEDPDSKDPIRETKRPASVPEEPSKSGNEDEETFILVARCKIEEEDRELHLDLKTRLRIARQAMELYTLLLVYGIDQDDLAPRNIMITNFDPEEGFEVMLLDLSHAFVLGSPISEFPLVKKLPSPREVAEFVDGFTDWVPEYDRDGKKVIEWRRKCWPETDDV
ncbi:hypothetical protein VTK73DRAFT_8998 [Phialemonium thermophilum]|uniref:Protein kinase domain-containing protein n=1 Tax=Phialemonium thermophilum TaxID=223376 RepID=A0ABR3W5B6_9PEZI